MLIFVMFETEENINNKIAYLTFKVTHREIRKKITVIKIKKQM